MSRFRASMGAFYVVVEILTDILMKITPAEIIFIREHLSIGRFFIPQGRFYKRISQPGYGRPRPAWRVCSSHGT